MTAYQMNLLGEPTIAGDLVDHLRHILENQPETRDSYKALQFAYWEQFQNLADYLGDIEALRRFYVEHAKSGKTIINWCRRLQRAYPHLAASPEVQRLRDTQSRRGPNVR